MKLPMVIYTHKNIPYQIILMLKRVYDLQHFKNKDTFLNKYCTFYSNALSRSTKHTINNKLY